MRARGRGDGRLRAPRRRPSHRGGPLGEDNSSRNAAYVEAGRAEFLVAALEDLDLGDRRFDKIFAVRVCLFHRNLERARSIAEKWLAPAGTLSVFFDQTSNA